MGASIAEDVSRHFEKVVVVDNSGLSTAEPEPYTITEPPIIKMLSKAIQPSGREKRRLRRKKNQ